MTETIFDDGVRPDEADERRGNADDLPAWLTRAARVPRLSRAEERALGERIAAGDREAADQLVEANLRLVFKTAGRFRWAGVPFEDLVQEGMLGLIRAARTFHPNGTAFSTYAVTCIEGTIKNSLRGRHLVRVPVTLQVQLDQLRRAVAQLEQTHGRAPTEEEIAEALGWSLECVRSVLQARVNVDPVNVDAPLVSGNGEDGEGLNLGSLLTSTAPAPDQVAQRRADLMALQAALAELPGREAEVLRLRYGLDGDDSMTTMEVGKQLKRSRQRVEQIESRGLERLWASITAQTVIILPTDVASCQSA